MIFRRARACQLRGPGNYVLDAIAAATPMIVVPAMPAAASAGVEPRPMMPQSSAYETRDGYRADFLGAGLPEAPLPEVVRSDDVREVTWHGQLLRAMPYRHFSVVMSTARRMCYVSACNIDGGSSVAHLRRRDWRFNPATPRRRSWPVRSTATHPGSVAGT